jgi:3-oxoadipate enol-lactonase
MTVSPVRLHCQVEGRGPELVILHPVGLDHTFMGALSASVRDAWHVVSIDLRGHGRSPAAAAGATLDDYVADIHDAVARHCVAPPVVLGLSFGGMLAQLLALTHPAAVAGLVLCGCPPTINPEARPALRERGLAAERNGMEAIVAPTLERWFTPRFLGDPAVEGVRNRLLRDDPLGWSAAWHAISTFDALPRLGEIHVPALVVAGEHDAATPAETSRTLAHAIPGAGLSTVRDAPHMMQLETQDAFNAVVGEFLAERRRAIA